MDLSIRAGEVKDELLRTLPKAGTYVKKSRHHDCHDSALLVIHGEYALLGVFDGVSGQPFAASASETALRAVQVYIEKTFKKKPLEELLEAALQEANFVLNRGATTASVALVLTDGRYYFANAGDSHAYIRTAEGVRRLTQEFRETGSLITYLADRKVVTQCLGGLLHHTDTGKGRMGKGDFLLVITDGVIDNLRIETEGGRVLDTSGKADLEGFFSRSKDLPEWMDVLAQAVKSRMVSPERIGEGYVLVPKEDDAAMAILKY